MKKIIKDLGKICESLNGKLLMIGIDDSYLEKIISKNDLITHFDALSSINKNSSGKGKRVKILTAKRLKKHYRKKRVDNIICDYDHIEETIKHFVSSSIYITNKNIYIKVKNKDLNTLVSKYKRYTNKIIINNYELESLVIIDSYKLKPNKFKDIFYTFLDTSLVIIDYISDFLIK